MARSKVYWSGPKPTGAKRWQGADSAELLDLDLYAHRLFRMYRGYAKQWNDIELDTNRCLSEHTHRVSGAHASAGTSGNKFIFSLGTGPDDNWILDLSFDKSFKRYHPTSCGLNALRTTNDIKHAAIHWRGHGRASFDKWLEKVGASGFFNGEATEYKS